MRSLKFIGERSGRVITSLALLLSTITPTLLPGLAAAAQLTDRSIELSSSNASAASVSYNVSFTTTAAARAVAVQFCENTPLIGEDCDTPAGFSLASANVPAVNSGANDSYPTVAASMGPVLVLGNDTSLQTPGVQNFVITGVTNPSASGPLYARIITYTGADEATAIASATADYNGAGDNDGIGGVGTVGANAAITKDSGSVAVSITDGIGVTGDVLETMTFCVSGTDTIIEGCAGGVAAPSLEIGEDDGSGVIALSTGAVSEASVYTQISTNALSGAVISLKSNTLGCGGLSRLGGGTDPCGVPASGAAGNVAEGTAGIGVKGATATDEGANATGTYQVAGVYNDTNYRLNWVSGDATGVTSTYGDPFLDTDGGPVSNKEMALTFGASISPTTAAGRYTANYSLIATGTF